MKQVLIMRPAARRDSDIVHVGKIRSDHALARSDSACSTLANNACRWSPIKGQGAFPGLTTD